MVIKVFLATSSGSTAVSIQACDWFLIRVNFPARAPQTEQGFHSQSLKSAKPRTSCHQSFIFAHLKPSAVFLAWFMLRFALEPCFGTSIAVDGILKPSFLERGLPKLLMSRTPRYTDAFRPHTGCWDRAHPSQNSLFTLFVIRCVPK